MELCGPCKFRNTDIKAVQFCKTCQEPQCKECADVHRSSKATRTHLLIIITDLNKDLKICQDLDKFQRCSDHFDKPLDFFCVDHSHLMCSTCLLLAQKSGCKSIIDITTAREFLVDQYHPQIERDLDNVIDRCKRNESKIVDAKISCIDRETDLTKYLVRTKIKIIEIFEKYEKRVKMELSKMVEQQISALDELEKKSTETRKTAENNKEMLKTVIQSGSGADFFRCALSITEQLDELNSSSSSTITNIKKQSLLIAPTLNSFIEDRVPLLKCDTEENILAIHAQQKLETGRSTFLDSIKHLVVPNENETGSNEILKATVPHGISDGNPDNAAKSVGITSHSTSVVTAEKIDIFDNNSYKGDIDNEVTNKSTSHSPDSTTTNQSTSHSPESTKTNQSTSRSPASTKTSDTMIKQGLLSSNSACNIQVILPVSYVTIPTPDGKQPVAEGVATLHDGRLVLSDIKGSRLIILNENFTYNNQFVLSKQPGNVSVLDDSCIAVCLQSTFKVALISTENEFKWVKSIQTRYHPKGICTIDNNSLLVSMRDGTGSWYMSVYSREGKVLREIKMISPKFDAFHIASFSPKESESERYFLQCCKKSNSLHCFTANGKEVYKYSIMSPNGVYVDTDSNVYVLESYGILHILSKYGHLINKTNLYFSTDINGISCNTKLNRFVVTRNSGRSICALNITRK
ncbi:uncharacterized protein LOC128559312 [Mercenaria mercenaria]|uniref:uncharacterized protein LOC128559312 n=1 Tax=Mercenaria mercenaria TaxID=6596 RepID=UPI00234EE754|nr:uncharacterized protein LOC128559312 [Mercenaria mercenaria]